jgi:hypothetical protein
LLVTQAEEGHVRNGWLGCPNCRRDFPVSERVADLRLEADSAAGEVAPLEDDELALKIVALSGLAQERGHLLVDGRLAAAAGQVVSIAPELEVVVVSSTLPDASDPPGVSRILSDRGFPLAEHRLRAVAIGPGGDPDLVRGAARRVAAGGRLILFDSRPEDRRAAEESGLTILADDGWIAVAERSIDRSLRLE